MSSQFIVTELRYKKDNKLIIAIFSKNNIDFKPHPA